MEAPLIDLISISEDKELAISVDSYTITSDFNESNSFSDCSDESSPESVDNTLFYCR